MWGGKGRGDKEKRWKEGKGNKKGMRWKEREKGRGNYKGVYKLSN